MSVFGNYAKYYDVLYHNKDYLTETNFVLERLRQNGFKDGGRVLDLGVGSGRHAEHIVRTGAAVHGVDFSEGMLRLAEERRRGMAPAHAAALSLTHGDVRSVRIKNSFDAVISLFHVLSYQTSDADIVAMLKTVHAHLPTKGLALCDFWWGPAVEREPPVARERIAESENIVVKRRTRPVWRHDRHVVEVNFDLEARSQDGKLLRSVQETHSMRYFYQTEIETYLADSNMCLIEIGEWLTARPPDAHAFNAYFVARAL